MHRTERVTVHTFDLAIDTAAAAPLSASSGPTTSTSPAVPAASASDADPTPPSPSVWRGEGAKLPEVWRWRAPWRGDVQRRRARLVLELARLDDRAWTPAQRDERGYLMDTLLRDAERAATARVGLVGWWYGTEVERAWGRLREVEERTIDLLPDDELPARAADAEQHAAAYLQGTDPRVRHLITLTDRAATGASAGSSGLRAAIVEVLRAAHAASDRVNQEARALRNRLVLASGLCVSVVMAVLVAQRRLGPTSLVALPETQAAPLPALAPWRLLAVVVLFGLVGAMLSAVPAMANVPTDRTPFNLPLQQALLKLTLGPLTALVGLVLVTSPPLSGLPLEEATTWPAVLLLAVLFGAGQQAVTGFVDRRAGEILEAKAVSG